MKKILKWIYIGTFIMAFPWFQTYGDVVKYGGAIPNDTISDTEAIQKTINRWDVVYFPLGNYIVDEWDTLKIVSERGHVWASEPEAEIIESY